MARSVEKSAINSTRVFDILYGLLALGLVFSFEFPIIAAGSSYVSINSEDLFILALTIATITSVFYSRRFHLNISLPRVCFALLLASMWIILTVGIAAIRVEDSIILSVLWSIKWLEGVILFFVLNMTVTRRRARTAVLLILFAGTVLGLAALATLFFDSHRVRFFFGNPNTLAAFLTLPVSIWLSKATQDIELHSLVYVVAGAVPIVAIIMTGSRSGLLALGVVILVLLLLGRRDIGRKRWISILTAAVGSIAAGGVLVSDSILRRLTGWVTIEGGRIMLTDSTAARSFKIRLELIHKAFALAREYPVFGHGWYASPSRIGVLDVHYTTLLAEIGVIGLLILLFLYSTFIRVWFHQRKHGETVLSTACIAWYCGLLVQSIGGNFPRTPHIMYITLVMVVCVNHLRTHDGYYKV